MSQIPENAERADEGKPENPENMKNHLDVLSPLTALSPVDGRYAEKTKVLRQYFSEFALIKGRIEIEIEYLIAISEQGLVRKFNEAELALLRNVYLRFSLEDAFKVKHIEETTRHDVKSIEYFLKDKLKGTTLEDVLGMVHFALTSEDVTNLAQNLAIQRAKNDVLVPAGWKLVHGLLNRGEEWKSMPMLARTHGREAPATTLGKEVALPANRLAKKLSRLSAVSLQLTGKMTGVVGNLHDHKAAAPEVDWQRFSIDFVKSLGLEPQLFTTQIEPHDRWAEMLHLIGEIMDIVEGTDQNLWTYLSHDYFFLKPRKGQIGSSVMPHKGRNPIDLENSEGNAVIASALCKKMAEKLPQSRLQRHLSDSTIARNYGVVFAHALLALENATSDIRDLEPKVEAIKADLEHKWAIITSGIQTRLRLLGVVNAYELFDSLAKAGPITQKGLHVFIDTLPVAEEEKEKFKNWTPENYLGDAVQLTEAMILEARMLDQK